MASAGTVEIDFAAETAKFTAELKKVRGQLSDLQSTTKRMASGFSTAGKAIAGVFTGLVIGRGISAVVRATSEAEESSAKLENALRSSGAAASLSADRLRDYTTALQHTTTFGDEAIQDVESLLLSFKGLSGDAVLKATSAVLDLSTRMGVDLHSAAIQVGKALADPAKGLDALARSGVKLPPALQQTVQQLVKTGNQSKAQALILQELEHTFGGAAAAARDNFGGALIGVKNDLGELLEAKQGLPAATASLKEMSKTLQDPAVVAGADALFSALIRGAAAAGRVIAETSGGLAVLAGQGGNAVVDIDKQIDELRAKRDQIANFQGDFSEGFTTSQREKLISEVDADLAKLQEQQEKLLELGKFAPQIAPAVVTQSKVADRADTSAFDAAERKALLDKSLAAAQAALQTTFNEFELLNEHADEAQKRIITAQQESHDQLNQLVLDNTRAWIESEDAKRDATFRSVAARYDAEVDFQQRKRLMEQDTFDLAVNLASTLAGKSKTAAKILIAINKARAIAQAVQNTAVAYTGALASVPYPFNLAAAQSVAILGGIQVGLIAATGFAEISQVGSGASGGGGGAITSMPSQDELKDHPPAGVTQGKVFNVNLYGNIAGPDSAKWLIDTFKDLINNSDTIIINGKSRQAAEIRGG